MTPAQRTLAALRSDTWEPEIAALRGWVHWCAGNDHGEIARLCGVTFSGSPRTIMRWDQGAPNPQDAHGYAETAPMPDYRSRAVNEFMADLRQRLPASYAAILAKHYGIVDGHSSAVRSLQWIAEALYQAGACQSLGLLERDCSSGYAALREWLRDHTVEHVAYQLPAKPRTVVCAWCEHQFEFNKTERVKPRNKDRYVRLCYACARVARADKIVRAPKRKFGRLMLTRA